MAGSLVWLNFTSNRASLAAAEAETVEIVYGCRQTVRLTLRLNLKLRLEILSASEHSPLLWTAPSTENVDVRCKKIARHNPP